MSLSDVLKWMFAIFCFIVTILVFMMGDLIGPLFNDPMRTFTRSELSMRFWYAFLVVLPMLIYTTRTPLLPTNMWHFLRFRMPIHFLLTGGVVFAIAANGNWPFLAWFPPLFTCYCLIASYVVRFGVKSALLKKERDEQMALQVYTEELEKQYASIRKFEHDYQNILLSMRGFLDEGDLPGLREYFTTQVEVESEAITKNHFALRHLDKIKVREIKSVLTTKLSLAQHSNIWASFEANEVIDDFLIDSVKLVRMLGILLDNAIEAVSGLEKGQLFVGCFRWKSGIHFIIQNTCPPDMPPFHMIWEAGFSTKGPGRGLGLNNLAECVASLPAVSLQTNIIDKDFVQTLIIDAEGKKT